MLVATAATATAVATTAAAAEATTAARTTTAAAAAAGTTATAAAAAAAAATLLGLVHPQGTSVQLGAVESRDGALGIGWGAHLDEREAAWSTGVTVGDDRYADHLTSVLGKSSPQRILRCVI